VEPLSANAVDAFLEALGLERRLPDARFFEDLFLRFQRRVATETLTRPAGDPSAFDPEAFAAGWIEEERGLVGEERTAMFLWLARTCGFEVATTGGTGRRPWETDAHVRDEPRFGALEGAFFSKANAEGADHTLIATIDGRRVLADAGFPLPVLVPLDPPAQEIPTGMGSLSAAVEWNGSVRVTCDARGDVAELLLITPATNPTNSLPFKEISRTFPDARTRHDARRVFALRLLDDRVLYWHRGRMTILDAWSRLDYPLRASERGALAKLFALELDGVDLQGENGSAAPARLSVFHRSPLSAAEARARAAKEMPDLTLVTGHEILAEESASGSRVEVRAILAASLPPEGPGEAVRKTLVFHLIAGVFSPRDA
jgi:hypothetical protein